ncbi:fasciclin-like arabinogalactan protein 14 [Argentina anserina]|uniref:fasciclin-like arabinogalactan protein 14 n=1 Tax=Argentina anserina TaxID=57926 RepID=UPI0021766186|nr:fasciclin-like arabinogalactan protein 14 [Potentilla anserina]
MKFPISTLLLSSFCLFSCSYAFNITDILSNYKDFSTFNDYLTRTTIADQINKRDSLTIFVVDNDGMGSITKKSLDMVAKLLSVHVALEYFDTKKLQQLPTDEPTIMTTLLQANGQATGQQGFLKATIGGNSTAGDGVSISSASSPDQSANIVQMVTSQPYNISVFQISNAIVPNIISPPIAAPTHMPTSPAESPADSPHSPKGLLDSPNAAPGTGTADGSGAASPDGKSKSAGTPVFSISYAYTKKGVNFATLIDQSTCKQPLSSLLIGGRLPEVVSQCFTNVNLRISLMLSLIRAFQHCSSFV